MKCRLKTQVDKKCERILIQASSSVVPIQKCSDSLRCAHFSFLSPGDKFGNVFKVRQRLLPKMGHNCHYLQGPSRSPNRVCLAGCKITMAVSLLVDQTGGEEQTETSAHTIRWHMHCHTMHQVLSNYSVNYCDFRKWDHIARLSPDSVSQKPLYMIFKF